MPDLVDDNSDSDLSSDEDDDVPLDKAAEKKQRQQAAAARAETSKRRSEPPEFDSEAVVIGEGHLAGLAPPGMHSLEVATIVFDDPSVREVAMCTEVPSSLDESEIKRVVN